MESWYLIGSFTVFLLPLLGLLGAVFYGVPKTYIFFKNWKESGNSNWFSASVFFGFATFGLIAFFYLVYIRAALHYRLYIHSYILELCLSLLVIYLTYSIFIPKTLHYFEHWKKTNKSYELSMIGLFGILSFYGLSLLFFRLVISAFGVFSDVIPS